MRAPIRKEINNFASTTFIVTLIEKINMPAEPDLQTEFAIAGKLACHLWRNVCANC